MWRVVLVPIGIWCDLVLLLNLMFVYGGTSHLLHVSIFMTIISKPHLFFKKKVAMFHGSFTCLQDLGYHFRKCQHGKYCIKNSPA